MAAALRRAGHGRAAAGYQPGALRNAPRLAAHGLALQPQLLASLDPETTYHLLSGNVDQLSEAAKSSEKAMIEMLLKMLGTLHDINKQHEGIAIGSDSIGKDGNGVSNEYQRQFETKASPAQLEETLNKVKKMSLRIKSPGIASKLAALPTTMLAVYKE